MKRVERGEIMGLADYEMVRDSFRRRIIEEKKLRRVKVGPSATLLFENHDTVLLQIQEMLRTERITREPSVLHEIETYNELIGGPDELSATIMIEIDDATERDAFLKSARGIEEAFAVVVDGETCRAKADPKRALEDRASAVIYVHFALTEQAARTLRAVAGGAKKASEVAFSIAVDHDAYRVETKLEAATIASVAQDLV